MYCAIKENNVVLGESKEDVVCQIFEWQLKPHNFLKVKCKGYNEQTYHSYDMFVWTEEEVREDVIKFLFGKLDKFGYKVFIEYK